MSTVKAIYKNLRSSPRKIKRYFEIYKRFKSRCGFKKLYRFSEKRVSKEISKTIKSAVSNAENNNQLDIDNLIIKEAYVGKGITL